MGRYIRLNAAKKVAQVRYGDSIVPGEMASDVGKVGQLYKAATGAFADVEKPEPVYDTVATIAAMQEQLTRIGATLDLLLAQIKK